MRTTKENFKRAMDNAIKNGCDMSLNNTCIMAKGDMSIYRFGVKIWDNAKGTYANALAGKLDKNISSWANDYIKELN